MRVQILNPFKQDHQNDYLINDCKATAISNVQAPPVSLSDISWDALSYKIPMSTAEYLLQQYPQLIQSLSPGQLAVLDSIEQQCGELIAIKCQEFRARTNSIPDEFISDVSIYLELKLNGGSDPARQQRIDAISQSTLISYIDKMQSLFASGHLPGTLSPSKIFACQDIKSITDLRSSILQLSVSQIQDLRGQNPDSMRPAEFNPHDEIPLINDSREVMKGVTAGIQTMLGKTIGEKNLPNQRLDQQISGGGNTFAQSVDLATKDAVLNLDEKQDLQVTQQVSLLLACVRMRLNAIQDSPFELATSEDLDHLEIVKKLTRYRPSSVSDELAKTALYLQDTYEKGHNVVKFEGKNLPQELVTYLDYCIDGHVKNMLKSVPFILNDPGMSEKYMKFMLMTMAQTNRLSSEINQRLKRRIAVSAAFD